MPIHKAVILTAIPVAVGVTTVLTVRSVTVKKIPLPPRYEKTMRIDTLYERMVDTIRSAADFPPSTWDVCRDFPWQYPLIVVAKDRELIHASDMKWVYGDSTELDQESFIAHPFEVRGFNLISQQFCNRVDKVFHVDSVVEYHLTANDSIVETTTVESEQTTYESNRDKAEESSLWVGGIASLISALVATFWKQMEPWFVGLLRRRRSTPKKPIGFK